VYIFSVNTAWELISGFLQHEPIPSPCQPKRSHERCSSMRFSKEVFYRQPSHLVFSLIIMLIMTVLFNSNRGSQRDVTYLGWPIAPSYMSPNAGKGGEGLWESQPMSTPVHKPHWAQINFGDLTPYLTYAPPSPCQPTRSYERCSSMRFSKEVFRQPSHLLSSFCWLWPSSISTGDHKETLSILAILVAGSQLMSTAVHMEPK
jgi:hypothetical protein